MKIYKYIIPIQDDPVVIKTKHSYDILSVGKTIDDCLCVWMTVDEKSPEDEFHKFFVAGTGTAIPDNVCPYKINFIGTVAFAHGRFVVHVFNMGYTVFE